MNSDEPQFHEQEPAGETFKSQQQGRSPLAEASDVWEEQSATDELTQEPADASGATDVSLSANANEQEDSTEVAQELAGIATPSEPLRLLDTLTERVSESNEMRSPPALSNRDAAAELTQTVADLRNQEQELRQKIALLQETQSKILSEQLAQTQAAINQMIQEGLTELEQRKQALQLSVEQLERRRERIRTEMRTTFAGVSQDLAIRVQGFKDYLTGSLQDLASAAEQLDLIPVKEMKASAMEETRFSEKARSSEKTPTPKFAEQGFQEQTRQIRKILDQYRTMPDYYGPSWQLRRTFEPIHAERVSNWFFSQGGRGAIRTMGSRLQNILIASAIISVMRTLYSDRLRTLIIANTPERLGEWRRGLQDCLGISRADFGPERGIVLFEEAPALVLKADRLIEQKQLPLIIVDETEDLISLSLLQYPLWLAFAPDPQQMSAYQYER
jgi:myosin heavy subunit